MEEIMADLINPEQRRSIAFIGHSGVGKTALAEQLLFSLGKTTRVGKTTDGSSHLDFEPEEIKRGTTLKTSAFDFTDKQLSMTIIDTPGSSSFIIDTQCALRGADAALLVVGATSGIRVQGEKGWVLAEREGIARAIFINEMDKERATFESALESVKTALEIEPVVVQLPIGAAIDFKGVIDLISMKAIYLDEQKKVVVEAIPEAMVSQAEEARSRLIEQVVETDDTLLEKYLDGATVSEEEIRSALKSGFAQGDLFPVFCGSAETANGITLLEDAFRDLFPSPLERSPYQKHVSEGKTADVTPETEAPFVGIIFKTFADPFTGQVSLMRVVTGALNSDETVYNSTTQSNERVGKLHLQLGKEHEAVDSVGVGGIVAITKLKHTHTGDTLCALTDHLELTGFNFPESCISFAIEPKNRGDEDKILSAVDKISTEDPAICVKRDPSTHETIISGMGQNHIEITLERIKRKFGVELEIHSPKVPYREAITRQAEAQGKHKKQSGGRGQYGDCWLRIKPLAGDEDFGFHNEIFGGSIPKNYIPAVEKGVIEAMSHGVLAGFPMVGVDCTVYDGSYHAVDSSDLAFKLAASKGFKIAVEKAGPVLLEPVMHVEITVPDEATGDIIGDLNGRRGKVISMDAKGHNQIIKAEVPLAEILTYAADIRSITADRGSFHLEYHGYQRVPSHIADKVISVQKAAAKTEAEH